MATTPTEGLWPSECVAWNCEPELASLLGRQPPPRALAARRTDALSCACPVADLAATTPRLLRAGATGACGGCPGARPADGERPLDGGWSGSRVRRTML